MPLAVSIARVARRTLDVLLLLLIGLVVVTMVIARVIPAVTGGATFVVGGGSMEPTIPLGSAVVTAPVAATDLAVGDIVSLRVGDQHAVFTHRIIRLADRDGALWLETRGDANTAADPSIVPATDVIGRVSLSIPLAGYLVMVLGSAQGMLFLVSLGVLVLAGAWMLETFEDDRAESMRRRTRDGFGPLLSDTGTGQGAPG